MLDEVLERIEQAACKSGRKKEEVALLAVSKTWPAERLQELYSQGQRLFGENKQQEAEAKIPLMPEDTVWHFIGRLQRNKVRKVLRLLQVIHSVDSMKLANFIDRVAGEEGIQAEIFLEVNLAEEVSKGGFLANEVGEAVKLLQGCSNLKVRGLMAIPPYVEDAEKSRSWFCKLRGLRDEIQASTGLDMPDLSMGMSGDYEVAVEEGSTIVRVGSALFGKRDLGKGGGVTPMAGL